LQLPPSAPCRRPSLACSLPSTNVWQGDARRAVPTGCTGPSSTLLVYCCTAGRRSWLQCLAGFAEDTLVGALSCLDEGRSTRSGSKALAQELDGCTSKEECWHNVTYCPRFLASTL
jgi:hypothetical protein